MTVKYEVVPNNLQDGRYYPRVIAGEKINLDRLIQEISAETILTETDLRAAINALSRRVSFHLQNGARPDIEGLVSFSLSLSEDLTGAEANVSDAVTVRVNARTGTGLQNEIVKNISLERHYGRARTPTLTTLYNAHTKSNNVYTAGNIAKLQGDDMKFNPEASDEGVFFIAADGGTSTRAETYLDVASRNISLLIPAALTGEQYVEVRTRYEGKTLQSARMKVSVNPA